jgi:hypothetical protein
LTIFGGGYGGANRDEETSDEFQNEFGKLLLLVVAVGLFVVSVFLSVNEVRYLLWGTTVQTTQFSRQLTSSGGRASRQVMLVKYTFDDGGRVRKESDEVGLDFPFPPVNAVIVEYIPGTDSSRVHGHHQRWSFYVLGASVLLVGWQAWRFWKFYKS